MPGLWKALRAKGASVGGLEQGDAMPGVLSKSKGGNGEENQGEQDRAGGVQGLEGNPTRGGFVKMKWVAIVIGVIIVALGAGLAVRFVTMKHTPNDVTWSVDSSANTDVAVEGQAGGKVLVATGGHIVEVDTDGKADWGMKVTGGEFGLGGCWRTGQTGEYVGFWVPGRGVWVVTRDGKEVWHYLDAKLKTAKGSDDPTRAVVGDNDGTIYERTMQGGTSRVWNGLAKPREKLPEGTVVMEGDPGISGIDWIGKNFTGEFFFSMSRFGVVGKVDSDNELSWSWGALLLCNPLSVDVLSGGNILICDSGNHRIVEVSSLGNIVWTYDTRDRMPLSAERLWTGVTLIVYSDGASVINPDSFEMWSVSADDTRCVHWYG